MNRRDLHPSARVWSAKTTPEALLREMSRLYYALDRDASERVLIRSLLIEAGLNPDVIGLAGGVRTLVLERAQKASAA